MGLPYLVLPLELVESPLGLFINIECWFSLNDLVGNLVAFTTFRGYYFVGQPWLHRFCQLLGVNFFVTKSNSDDLKFANIQIVTFNG